MGQFHQNHMSEKELISKLQNEMRKQIKYLDESKWMFENNSDVNPLDNLPNNL